MERVLDLLKLVGGGGGGKVAKKKTVTGFRGKFNYILVAK